MYAFEYSYAANIGCVMPGTGPGGRPYNTSDIPISIWTTQTLNMTNYTAVHYTVSPVPQVFECNGVCHSNTACDENPALIGC